MTPTITIENGDGRHTLVQPRDGSNFVPTLLAVLRAAGRVKARKVGGSYQANGWIVGGCLTAGDKARFVFEFDDIRGMLHIFSPDQLLIGDHSWEVS